MATIHASSARQALVKACTLPLLAGSNIGAGFVVPTVAACVDLVVHLALEADGRRRVREVVRVTGRVEGDVIETETVFAGAFRDGGELTSPCCNVVRLRDGLVAHYRVYMDNSPVYA